MNPKALKVKQYFQERQLEGDQSQVSSAGGSAKKRRLRKESADTQE